MVVLRDLLGRVISLLNNDCIISGNIKGLMSRVDTVSRTRSEQSSAATRFSHQQCPPPAATLIYYYRATGAPRPPPRSASTLHVGCRMRVLPRQGQPRLTIPTIRSKNAECDQYERMSAQRLLQVWKGTPSICCRSCRAVCRCAEYAILGHHSVIADTAL